MAIYERAQSYGLPILFHQGTSPVRPAPIRYAHPLLTDEVAIRYPSLKIIMAHLGHPWTVDSAVVLPDEHNELAGDQFYYALSEERVDLLDQDLLVFLARQCYEGGSETAIEAISSDPLLS